MRNRADNEKDIMDTIISEEEAQELLETADEQIRKLDELARIFADNEDKLEAEWHYINAEMTRMESDRQGFLQRLFNDAKLKDILYTLENGKDIRREKRSIKKELRKIDANARVYDRNVAPNSYDAYFRVHPSERDIKNMIRELNKEGDARSLTFHVQKFNKTHGENTILIEELEAIKSPRDFDEASPLVKGYLREVFKERHPTYNELYKLSKSYKHHLTVIPMLVRANKYSKYRAERDKELTATKKYYAKKNPESRVALARQVAHNDAAIKGYMRDAENIKAYTEKLETNPESFADRSKLMEQLSNQIKDANRTVNEYRQFISNAYTAPDLRRAISVTRDLSGMLKLEVLSAMEKSGVNPKNPDDKVKLDKVVADFRKLSDVSKLSSENRREMFNGIISQYEFMVDARTVKRFEDAMDTIDEEVRIAMFGDELTKDEIAKVNQKSQLLAEAAKYKGKDNAICEEIGKKLKEIKNIETRIPANAVYKLSERMTNDSRNAVAARRAQFELLDLQRKEAKSEHKQEKRFNKLFKNMDIGKEILSDEAIDILAQAGLKTYAFDNNPALGNATALLLSVCEGDNDIQAVTKVLERFYDPDKEEYCMGDNSMRLIAANVMKYNSDCLAHGLVNPPLSDKILEMASKYSGAEFYPKVNTFASIGEGENKPQQIDVSAADAKAAARDNEDNDISSVNNDKTIPKVEEELNLDEIPDEVFSEPEDTPLEKMEAQEFKEAEAVINQKLDSAYRSRVTESVRKAQDEYISSQAISETMMAKDFVVEISMKDLPPEKVSEIRNRAEHVYCMSYEERDGVMRMETRRWQSSASLVMDFYKDKSLDIKADAATIDKVSTMREGQAYYWQKNKEKKQYRGNDNKSSRGSEGERVR